MSPYNYQPAIKLTRCSNLNSMESELTKEKLAAVKERFGREIRVFETLTTASSTSNYNNSRNNDDEPDDDFYELTAADYYKLTKKKDDKTLKTRKMREAELVAHRRSRERNTVSTVVIRVRFHDNYTLEAMFHPSETIQSLTDLLKKVIHHPEIPFYVYTTPPKKQLKDTSQDFYSAGFVPGANVYFSYATNPPPGPYLTDEVMSLQGLGVVDKKEAEATQFHPESEPVIADAAEDAFTKFKPAEKKAASGRPKWFKM